MYRSMTSAEAIWKSSCLGMQMKSSNSSVADMTGPARAQHVAKNVHFMKTIAKVILLCSQQEIGLRGHNESEDSLNRGNFLEILKLVALHDNTVQDRLQQGPRNTMYTSPEIQNSLLHIMGDMVRKMICDGVQQAGFFTLMADKVRTAAKVNSFPLSSGTLMLTLALYMRGF